MITIATHLSEISSAASQYRFRLLKELALHDPGSHVIFILDSEKTILPALPANCTVNLAGPRIRNRLLRKYFYDFKIPPVLQRYNVQVFIPEGEITTRAKIRQYRIDDKKPVFTRSIPQNLTGIITPDEDREEILSGYFNQVITVLPGAESFLEPFSFEEKINTLDEITGGDEYFITYFDNHSVSSFIHIMKAYSNFRKWQKSSMKLVLVCVDAVRREIEEKLSNYKYRNDVMVKDHISFHKLLPAAYSFIDTSRNQPYHKLDAFACNIPVIATGNDFEKTVLKASDNEISISEKMMVLYKEEDTRLQYIASGRAMLEKYDWKKSISKLLRELEQ